MDLGPVPWKAGQGTWLSGAHGPGETGGLRGCWAEGQSAAPRASRPDEVPSVKGNRVFPQAWTLTRTKQDTPYGHILWVQASRSY